MNKLIKYFAGKNKFQSFFERLHEVSLRGMNIGELTVVEESGELYALNHIHEMLKKTKDVVVFDVGANIGDYTKLINSVFKNTAQIFSFEPSKSTFTKLLNNTEGLEKVNRYNFGFGDLESEVSLYGNSNESLISSVYKRNLDHFDISIEKLETIQIKTIDDFCASNDIDRIHFLKIDVEGHEKKVLEGAKNMLAANKIDFIQFEFGGCNIDSRTYFQDFYYLLKSTYKIYRIAKDGLFEIKAYKESYEVFITTNYLAIKR